MHRPRFAWLLALVAAVLAVASTAAGAPERNSAEPTGTIVETAVAAGDFTSLLSLVQAAGLADTLANGGPFTVFAPTDAAFAKLPKATLAALAADPAALRSLLLSHVVAGAVPVSAVAGLASAPTLGGRSVTLQVRGGSVFVDGARVVAPDVQATNGIIHAIDAVLIPKAPVPKPKNIVATAAAAGSFETLTSLLKRAGLVGALKGRGPYTVFAPTDAAFAKVPKRTLAALARDRSKLRAVLLHHVAKGRLSATAVAKRASIRTLNGQRVRVRVAGKAVRLDGARVRTADVAASNGVIHAIDRVLIP